MKKIIYSLLFIIIGFTSCDDYLEVTPENVVLISSYEDVKAVMGACLAEYTGASNFSLSGTIYEGKTKYLILNYYTGLIDDYTYISDEHPWASNNQGAFNNSLSWEYEGLHNSLWKNGYEGIGFYNMVIEELSKLDGVSNEEAEIILGEAKYLRAYNLFKLMQYFTPYHTREDLGLPVNLIASEAIGYDASRKSQNEVYNIIISELEEILSYTTKPTTYNIFYDEVLVNALLAKVYWYKAGSVAGESGDFGKAIGYAQAALEGKNLPGIGEFGNTLELDPANLGIYKNYDYALLIHVSDESSVSTMYRDLLIADGDEGQLANSRLYSLYKDNDVRNGAWVDNVTGVVSKLRSHTGSTGSKPYFFFRLADLQLIIAECYARDGDNGKAIEDLEKFQQTRYTDYTGYSGSDVLQDILDERTREFCFEDDMVWIDMKRRGLSITRPALNQDDMPDLLYTLQENDYRYTFPIPEEYELENNKIEQNPNW